MKAELNKLGPAPSAYARLLEMSVASGDKMDIDTTEDSGRILIRDRFDKIERAKPAIHPSLLRAQASLSKQSLFGNKETPRANPPTKKEEGEGGVKTGKTKA